jgi:hypothetical protein
MFYDSAKGNEWTNSSHWTDPYKSHCSWHGVYCNDSNSTIKLELRNNGLSGTLSSSIANLSLIEYLNLADNDIMVGTFMCLSMTITLLDIVRPHLILIVLVGINTFRFVSVFR